MRTIRLLCGMLAMAIGMSTFPAFSQSIKIVTEEYPPYSYEENGEIKGVSTEVVRAVFKEAGMVANIKVYPWARAYGMAKDEANTLIYSISRTSNRENLFKWVGVIAPIDFYVFALKERTDIRLKGLEDAKNYRIGTVREDALEQLFSGEGFPKVEKFNSNEDVMKMLFLKRVDLWPISEFAGNYYLKKNNHPLSEVRKVFHIEGFASGDQYMAFGLSTKDDIINTLQSALKRIKDKGIYKEIIDKYVK